MIDNPDYKGEWKAKRISNPDYKGVWEPKKIANPKYEPDDKMYLYKEFGFIGFDLWQVGCELFSSRVVFLRRASKRELLLVSGERRGFIRPRTLFCGVGSFFRKIERGRKLSRRSNRQESRLSSTGEVQHVHRQSDNHGRRLVVLNISNSSYNPYTISPDETNFFEVGAHLSDLRACTRI